MKKKRSASARPKGSNRLKPADPASRVARWYPELRGMAARRRRQEHAHDTFQTTDLLHETYVRLAENGPKHYANRAHFFGSAKRAMNAAFVDHFRRRNAKKRGRDYPKVPLDEAAAVGHSAGSYDALDEALCRLHAMDPRLAQIVECRFFVGLSTAEISARVRRSPSAVRRDCAIARAWLRTQLANAG